MKSLDFFCWTGKIYSSFHLYIMFIGLYVIREILSLHAFFNLIFSLKIFGISWNFSSIYCNAVLLYGLFQLTTLTAHKI